MKPTDEEVKAEIARLKEMQPKVRHMDTFGGNNREKIDAQIDVLEESMDEDEIYERWGNDDDPDENYDIISNARYALEWVDGESEDGEPPSKGWEPLVQE